MLPWKLAGSLLQHLLLDEFAEFFSMFIQSDKRSAVFLPTQRFLLQVIDGCHDVILSDILLLFLLRLEPHLALGVSDSSFLVKGIVPIVNKLLMILFPLVNFVLGFFF